MGVPEWEDRHFAMRYGATDLMRCTEQTAVLMAGAEGMAIEKDDVAELATLSMAGWIAGSPYKPKINVYDELYEAGKGGKALRRPRRLWDAVVNTEKSDYGIDAGALSVPLEFCFTPVDGKRALVSGQTGGTVSCLCFAAQDDDGSTAFWPTPKELPNPKNDREEKRGTKALAYRCPNYLVFCFAKDMIESVGGTEFLREFVASTTADCDGLEPATLISRLFDGHGAKPGIRRTNGLAVLDEPGWLDQSQWNRTNIPARKKRVFHGSSIALSLATFFRNGYDCSISVTRHQHLIAASIASRVLGGALFAIPLDPVPGGSVAVNGAKLLTVDDFLLTDSAAMVVSGISEHIPIGAVARRDDSVTVHSVYLSAHTGSFRQLKHRIRLHDETSSVFTSFGTDVYGILEKDQPLPAPVDRPAKKWMAQYDDMFNRARQDRASKKTGKKPKHGK